MGTQFHWFYDILILAIFLGITFKCYKRGFVSSVVSLGAVLVSFILAMIFSAAFAPAIYDGFIRERTENYINDSLSDIINPGSLLELSGIDTSQIIINDIPLSEMNITPDRIGNINLDLSNVDLSGTGISELDLEFFGITDETLSSINAGRAVITTSELSVSDLDTLIMAKILTSTLQQNGTEYAAIKNIAQTIDNVLPQIPGNAGGTVNNAVSQLIVTSIESGNINSGLTNVLMDNLITPIIIIPLRTLIFFILFVIMCLVLSFLAKSLAIVNRIPVIGRINSGLGIIMGIIQSVIIIFLVCIGVNILIALTGNNIIFLNTMTIDESFVFGYIYNLRLLTF
jgi:hypothetical protein